MHGTCIEIKKLKRTYYGIVQSVAILCHEPLVRNINGIPTCTVEQGNVHHRREECHAEFADVILADTSRL